MYYLIVNNDLIIGKVFTALALGGESHILVSKQVYDRPLETLYLFDGEVLVRPPKPADGLEYLWDVELQQWIYDIDKAKVNKSDAISEACANQIYAGYQSDALGLTHNYPAKDRDQANMTSSVTDSLNPLNDETWQTPFWCADAGGVWECRMHTAAQIQKAGYDGKAHITACLFKNAELQAKIIAATTKEELDVITFRSHDE